MGKFFSCPWCGSRIAKTTVEELTNSNTVHQCCGCSCHVCADGHTVGVHTKACSEHFWQEMEQDMELES